MKVVVQRSKNSNVIVNGKIVGDNTHKKLLKENKYYQDLYRGNK